ncbi:hypothetical protein BEI64_03640 [Eisenbergiella tayi]|uniref:Uncharacterized protein n=1 Tax=Eisenbergiella tayi TaxID=1432052 RepID=A0ABX3ADB7_9FIRM|nr:hypothetical protein BEI63_18740 [Eisenbergiella tayi]ODR62464.1 hypothetical protein BEI64_03640 [Eisenbergiella tayi]
MRITGIILFIRFIIGCLLFLYTVIILITVIFVKLNIIFLLNIYYDSAMPCASYLPASDSLPGGDRVQINLLRERLRLPGCLFRTACGTVRIPERAV